MKTYRVGYAEMAAAVFSARGLGMLPALASVHFRRLHVKSNAVAR